MTLKENLEQTKWIPCSERLPKESSRYLVTRGLKVCNNLWNRAYIVNYSDLMGLCKEKIWWDGNVGKSDFKKYDDVLAWMPLPKPYKEDLRDICNERIEIECTHGTCKDCFYYNIDEDGHGYHCEKYGHTRFPVYADFYCKDFEKRGGENELN